MTIIACVDNANGMMFNHRRQSQDKKLREYILELVSPPNKLWMNAYSRKQFTEAGSAAIAVNNAFLEKAKTKDFCFVENIDISPHIDNIEKIILFKWNRNYPADIFFPIDLSIGWTLEESEDFAGSSHNKITKEIYQK